MSKKKKNIQIDLFGDKVLNLAHHKVNQLRYREKKDKFTINRVGILQDLKNFGFLDAIPDKKIPINRDYILSIISNNFEAKDLQVAFEEWGRLYKSEFLFDVNTGEFIDYFLHKDDANFLKEMMEELSDDPSKYQDWLNHLNFHCLDKVVIYRGLPDVVFNLDKRIIKLRFSYQSIKRPVEIPKSIKSLTQLKELEIISLPITDFSRLCSLPALEELIIRKSNISKIPDCIANLTQLKKLILSENQISEISNKIGDLIQLESLDLSENLIRKLPETIGFMSQLKSLDLSKNYLIKLPKTIVNLTKLQSLYLSDNSFTTFPETICQLKSLYRLNIEDNGIEIIPSSISQLQSLKYFNIINLPLESLPKSLLDIYLKSVSCNSDKKEIIDLIKPIKEREERRNKKALQRIRKRFVL